jgi:hypothetical protein
MVANRVAILDHSGASEFNYLTPEEVSNRWRRRITPETLANWRALHVGPAYSKFGKAVLYRLDLLEQWETKHLVKCDLSSAVVREQISSFPP